MSARHGLLAVALLAAVAAPAGAQRTYSASLLGTRMEHRVRAGSAIERSSGTLVGGELGASSMWLEVRAHALGGQLTRQDPAGEDRTVGEISIAASALPLPWLAFTIGGTGRSYTTPLARQRWISVSTGVEARVQMLDGAIRGASRIALMPAVSVSGLDSPNFAAVGGVDVSFHARVLTAKLAYSLERYDFPTLIDTRRLEQSGLLTASMGIRFGSER